MALKHSVSIPAGITATGVLVHKVTQTTKDVFFESKNETGRFAAGKSIEKQTDIEVSGDMESTATLPAAGTGANTAASPKIDEVMTSDLNEKAAEFTIKARYTEDGEGDY